MPAVRLIHSDKQPRGRGFSAPGLAHKTVSLVLFDGKRDIVDCIDKTPKAGEKTGLKVKTFLQAGYG
jgi:hypothetical protein